MATITECGNPSNSFSFEPLEMWEFTPIIYLNAQPVDYDNNEDTKLVYNVDEKVALSDKISKLFRDKYTLMEFSTQSNTLTLEFEVKNGTTDQFYDEDGYIEPKIELAPNEKELTTEEYIKITGDKSFLVDYSKQETTIIKITVDMNTKTDRVFFINFYANDDKTYFDIEGAYKNVFCGQVKMIKKNNSTRPVTIHITNKKTGTGLVKSYPDKVDTYQVPLYKMIVSGFDNWGNEKKYSFNVIRYGVQYDKKKNIAPRIVGISKSQEYIIKWDSSTMGGKGSWRVFGNWLIHKGASDPTKIAWGAIGCIEVCGINGWKKFNQKILELSNTNTIMNASNTEKIKVIYENAVPPQLIKIDK